MASLFSSHVGKNTELKFAVASRPARDAHRDGQREYSDPDVDYELLQDVTDNIRDSRGAQTVPVRADASVGCFFS